MQQYTVRTITLSSIVIKNMSKLRIITEMGGGYAPLPGNMCIVCNGCRGQAGMNTNSNLINGTN